VGDRVGDSADGNTMNLPTSPTIHQLWFQL